MGQVRLDSVASPRTRLTFVTPGILLRTQIVDPLLEDVTHVVIDEVMGPLQLLTITDDRPVAHAR